MVRERRRRGGREGLGAPKARVGKNRGKIAAQRRFSFMEIAFSNRIFIFFRLRRAQSSAVSDLRTYALYDDPS